MKLIRQKDGRLLPESVIHMDFHRQSGYSHDSIMSDIELGIVVTMAQEMEDLGMGALLDVSLMEHERRTREDVLGRS